MNNNIVELKSLNHKKNIKNLTLDDIFNLILIYKSASNI